MSLRRSIPAGLLDSGMASLATFVVGLYAVRVLDPASLGAYALFYSAFVTVTAVPAHLVFLPAQIAAARLPAPQRLGVLRRSLPLGLTPAVVSALVVTAVVLTVPGEVARGVARDLMVSTVACAIVSPVQDHVRSMLHIGDRSSAAAMVSGVQLVGVGAALAVFSLLGIRDALQPFGALAVANIMSSATGLALWRAARPSAPADALRLRDLVRSGKWLLVVGMAPHLTGFGAASLVGHLASAQALGYAEGARILARPIAVLSVGIKSVLGPRLMRAGARRDSSSSRRFTRVYVALVAGFGLVYLAVAGFDWPLNPLARIVPNAYVVTWLAAASIAVYIADRVAGAGASLQLMGAGRERSLAVIEATGSLGRIVGGATAPLTGPFAIPLGFLLMSIVRRAWLYVLLRRLYAVRGVGTATGIEPVSPSGDRR